ncbi:clavesin-1-like [Anopheles ziemanni]|uniref:clavesin-1-like n=1 Tax=Anopheles coustani TaxID=139045 RepID=UPI00265AF98D|nr:clavesin-1-like [Anopheles coustani]XP_058178483.1 clavesin-1-like [Anopheles ziemanni]
MVSELEALSVPCLEKAPKTYDDAGLEDPVGPASIKQTLESIREDALVRQQNVAQLRDWIAKHPHIHRCRTDALFLLRFLRSKKFSFLVASQTIERYLAARVLHPSWFQQLDVRDPELSHLLDIGFVIPLKERTADGCLVVLCDWGLLDPKVHTLDHSNRMHILLGEAYGEDPVAQCSGVIAIFNLEHVSLAHHGLISLSSLRLVTRYLNNAFPVRCQRIYAVNVPSAAMWIVNGFVGFLHEKIQSRFKMVRNFDELKEQFDANLLPLEYGGKLPKSEHIQAFREQCERYRNRMLALDEMSIDLDHSESYSRNAMLDDIEGGAVGSFRKLELD